MGEEGGSRSEEQKEAVCTDKGDGVAVDQLIYGIASAMFIFSILA